MDEWEGMKCAICHEAMNPRDPNNYRQVIGWEMRVDTRPSGHKGGSDITLRTGTGKFAHGPCVQLARSGVSPEQTTLV